MADRIRNTYWVFGNVDAADHMIHYYMGWNDSYMFGDLQDAMKFESWNALIEYVSKRWQLQDGIMIREVTNTLIERMEEGVAKSDLTLYHRMHDPKYMY